jgi:hypothetical protein
LLSVWFPTDESWYAESWGSIGCGGRAEGVASAGAAEVSRLGDAPGKEDGAGVGGSADGDKVGEKVGKGVGDCS